MNTNEIKKDLYKSKAVAKFSHYTTGSLYYNVDVFGVPHQFPIHVVEPTTLVREYIERDAEYPGYDKVRLELPTIKLADDLKGASFNAEIKGSDLNRWIAKAVEAGEFVCLAESN
jgi:hypothetical protein